MANYFLSILADFIADNAANSCPANGTKRTAACENCTADRTGAGTYGRTLIAPGHTLTTSCTQQDGRSHDSACKFLYCFHRIPFLIKRITGKSL